LKDGIQRPLLSELSDEKVMARYNPMIAVRALTQTVNQFLILPLIAPRSGTKGTEIMGSDQTSHAA